jgi:hypothetical protein
MNTAQPRPTGSGVKTNNTKGLIELNASVPASRPTGEARATWRMNISAFGRNEPHSHQISALKTQFNNHFRFGSPAPLGCKVLFP